MITQVATYGSVRCKAALLAMGVALLTSAAGCSEMEKLFTPDKSEPTTQPAAAEKPKTEAQARRAAVLAGTIGSVTIMGDNQGLRVRGFSLVIGLGENGSSDCPDTIREYLVEYLSKQVAPQGVMEDKGPKFSPQRLIDSIDTAVVEVNGVIPAGAPKGAVFDLKVDALPGTQTRSLEGGLLLPCELRLYDVSAAGEAIVTGRVVARGGGPVFLNPFVGNSESTTTDPRRGAVLGGGFSVEERTMRMQLLEPSYAIARRIEGRINERFGHSPKSADAQSKSYVTLHTPAAFGTRTERFTQLATHVLLESQPAFCERRLRELVEKAVEPQADLENISLVWEGLGRTAVPQIQPLYSNSDTAVSFYAARAGLRVKDSTAVSVLAEIAATRSHPYRIAAVRELGDCEFPMAASRLLPLLDADDQEIRIAAYEGLIKHRHGAVVSKVFRNTLDPEQVNAVVDVVETSGRPMIYVRRSRLPRIAIFGTRVPVHGPLFYSAPGDVVTLSSADANSDVTVFARKRYGRMLTEPVVVPPRVPELIGALADRPVKDPAGRLRGVGLNYSQVVQVLAKLCEEETIPARLVLEQVNLSELLGPQRAPERPESDEAPANTDDGKPADDQRRESDAGKQPAGRPEGAPQ